MAKKSDGTRELIISSYRDIERELEGNQEVLWTFFFPTREMEMFVGRFGKTVEGVFLGSKARPSMIGRWFWSSTKANCPTCSA